MITIQYLTTTDTKKILVPGPKGRPADIIENYYRIMTNAIQYNGVRYNDMLGRAEVYTKTPDGSFTIRPWNDADEAASRTYIELEYGLYSRDKHSDALRLLFRERTYNPLMDIIDGIEWDGKSRIWDFLTTWAKCENNDYTREVSRLIFAGGINRLYQPGCKFDTVPILIGTKQGEGKTSLIQLLALHEDYFGNINTIEGQVAIEQLQGRWICEIPEMFAVTKYKEQEMVKAYITRQVDSYRKPWDKNVSEFPRRCIFISSSNDAAPLIDRTGNRRWYPVEVHSSGEYIWDHEDEVREYILQCWGEARTLYKAGKLPPNPDPRYSELYRQAQENAMQDDWRVGAIAEYLETKKPGELVCVRELCHRVLSPNPTVPHDPTPAESKDIGRMLNKMDGWELCQNPRRVGAFGKQRAWIKTAPPDPEAEVDNSDPENW